MNIFWKAILVCSAVFEVISLEAQEGKSSLQYNLVEGLPNIYLDPLSEAIGCTWQYGNVWDKPLIRKFYSMLEQHKGFFVALDVGAQTGSFSLLAKYFPNSQWYAFEPLQEAAQTLTKNLSLNNIQNVSVYQMAASLVSGWTTLKMPPMNEWGLATIGSNVMRFSPVGERTIQCVDLDSFVKSQDIEHVDFIKIDTEGWELFILQGAEQLILRDRPILLMEHNDTNMKQCNSTRDDMENFLHKLNYEWDLVSSEDILCIPN